VEFSKLLLSRHCRLLFIALTILWLLGAVVAQLVVVEVAVQVAIKQALHQLLLLMRTQLQSAAEEQVLPILLMAAVALIPNLGV
jgi:hypothetical protein